MAEFIGWTGVVVYIAAYAFLSLGWMKADRVNYHLLNAIGGICLVIVSYTLSDMPNLFVNLAWIFIALISIIKIVSMKKAARGASKAPNQAGVPSSDFTPFQSSGSRAPGSLKA